MPNQNPMTDTRFMKEALKGQATNVLPMLLIGGWINVVFSGFVTSKIPFPITLQFKEMLQRGIELQSLDASWVSSASWYFLNVFGLRSIYDLVFNDHEDYFMDYQEYASNGLSNTPNEMKFILKAEWESLEITVHKWALKNIEKEILADICFLK
ncbi:ER membrane protein complex subunit 3 [Blattella germanica]|nr:ER membrane protein complex subunit 3 [Blattella germanica]